MQGHDAFTWPIQSHHAWGATKLEYQVDAFVQSVSFGAIEAGNE